MNKFYAALLFLFSVLFFSCSTTRQLTTSKIYPKRDSLNAVTPKNTNGLAAKYSTILNVKENELDNDKLLGFIDEWYGAPYKYGGRTKKGVDCSDFACIMFNNVYGINIAGSSKSLRGQCSKVKKDELQEGDLVFFKIKKRSISHVGVYLMNNYFIHASTKAGVVISNLNEDYYKRYFCCAGRIKKQG